LLKLVDDEQLRVKMSQHGWNHVKNQFHYTRLISDVAKLYHSLL
jgi:hypothetical protein